MRVTVVTEDKLIIVNGEALNVEHDYPNNLWAIQWYGDTGEAEWTDGPNIEVAFEDVQPFIAAWQAVKDSQHEPKPQELTYRELRAAEYPPIGDQLDSLFHAGVFPDWMAEKLQAVKEKHPKEAKL